MKPWREAKVRSVEHFVSTSGLRGVEQCVNNFHLEECGSDIGGTSTGNIPKMFRERLFPLSREQLDSVQASNLRMLAQSHMIGMPMDPRHQSIMSNSFCHRDMEQVSATFVPSTGTIFRGESEAQLSGSGSSFAFGSRASEASAGYGQAYLRLQDRWPEEKGFATPSSINIMSTAMPILGRPFTSLEVGQDRLYSNIDTHDMVGLSDATGLTSASELKCSPQSGGGSTADVDAILRSDSEGAERGREPDHTGAVCVHRNQDDVINADSSKSSSGRKWMKEEDQVAGGLKKIVSGVKGKGKCPMITQKANLVVGGSSRMGKPKEEQCGKLKSEGLGKCHAAAAKDKVDCKGKGKRKEGQAAGVSRKVNSEGQGRQSAVAAVVPEKSLALPVGTVHEEQVYCSRSGRRHRPKQLLDYEDVPNFSNLGKRSQTEAALLQPRTMKKAKKMANDLSTKGYKNSPKGVVRRHVRKGMPKDRDASVAQKMKEEKGTKENGSVELHPLSEFEVGDLVWAKSGLKNDPFWPAKVVDPVYEAPVAVRSLCQPGRLLVMFYGPAVVKARQRDYSWVKQGMIFPFQEYSVKFQTQAMPLKSRKKEFRRALEEALLYDVGVDVDNRHESRAALPARGSGGAGAVDEDMEDMDTVCTMEGFPMCNVLNDSQCRGCGMELTEAQLAKAKKGPSEYDNLCKPCIKLYESKQYCGVCKSVWLPNDKGSWVCCDSCSIWVHAECDRISGKRLKELQEPGGVYSCPECRRQQESPRKRKSPDGGFCSEEELCGEYEVPERLNVCCNGVKAVYLPKKHRVMCKCKEKCKKEKEMTVALWEQHTGGKRKHWRDSVMVANLDLSLGDWLKNVEDGGAVGLAFSSDEKKATPNDLTSFLSVPYERVSVRWTSERCAACHLTEDHESNQMVICNRCQVGVHEYCYGVRVSSITGAWVCRACEVPEVEKECFLCSVKGGALKPTDVEGLWAHVTCAWWVPGCVFKDVERMEPITGVGNIHLEHFGLLCCICKQPHGACVQCSSKKCCTPYHVTCAYKAGFHISMEPDKEQAESVSFISYCAKHRKPKKDLDCISQAAKSALQVLRWRKAMEQGKKGVPGCNKSKPTKRPPQVGGRGFGGEVAKRGMRVTRSDNGAFSMMSEGADAEIGGSARCRPYKPRSREMAPEGRKRGPVPYRVCGVTRHSMEEINRLRVWPEFISPDSDEVLPMKKRLQFLRETEKSRLCFGRSGIHGWGLIARRTIETGEMVVDYRGTLVRRSVADKREERYRAEGKDCYLFKITDEFSIDATERGNIARLINHSCNPNCYSHILEVEGKRHIVLIARQLIRVGEELTYDYKFDGEGDKKIPCLCGVADCRRYMN